MSGQKVLVTGGAGFIGTELIHQLADRVAKVVAVDNLANGRRENLEGLPKDRVEVVISDVRDATRMSELMKGVDVVFHLACLGVRHSIRYPMENHQVNATATLGLLEAAKKNAVTRFVHTSSSEVYGTARKTPMTEEHPTFPPTVYGSSKMAGECYARAWYETYGYPTVVVRPFNTYGPRCHHEGDSGEVIPRFVLRCMAGRPMVIFGNGTQMRDFTYVSDMARGIMMAGWADNVIGETINLGDGHEISINDLARTVADVLGKPDAPVVHDKPRPGDNLRLYADVTKAEELLGFKTEVTLAEGLASLKQWYESLGQSPEELLKDEVLYNWETDASAT